MSRLALIIAINYEGSACELNGCLNDGRAMSKYLRGNGFQTYEIFERNATARAIVDALTDVVRSQPSELFIHYSGHGSQTVDQGGDEVDGMDETIIAYDLIAITDDRLHNILKEYRGKLTAIFDCCHSGTILDHDQPMDCASCVILSGCRDYQTSADALIKGRWQGALTHAYLKYGMNIDKICDFMISRGYSQRPTIFVASPSL